MNTKQKLSGEQKTPEKVEVTASISGANEPAGIAPDLERRFPALYEYIFNQLETGVDKAVVLAGALEMNDKMDYPASKAEVLVLLEAVLATIDSAMDVERLFQKIVGRLILFQDDLSEPYFFCEGVPFKTPSKHVEAWAKYQYFKVTKVLPPKDLVRETFDILYTVARFDSPQIRMFNRVGRKDAAIVYDLADKRYITATPQGWEIVPAYPLFRRFKHQQVQAEPVAGGNPWEVFDFLTVPEESRLLVMVYLISLFVPGIAHPILAVCGDQGAAKSFFCTVINRLVDPTLTEKIIQPKSERDLIQTLRQKFVTVLDNISIITPRVSDILCQVCTGGGVSYRQLYTDEGENIAQFRHAVIINSINLPIVNADLMDRSIILKLQRIKPEDRKPEQDLWDLFNEAHPRILGGIFDTLVKAMGIYHTLQVENLPRLADFAKWGYAIAEALGKNGEQFVTDFTENVKNQNEGVTEKNILCQTILSLMTDETAYLNTVADTHKALKAIAGQDAKDATFPKLPHNMREQLDRLRSTLLEHGITFQFFDRTKIGVKILFSRTGSPATSASPVMAGSPASPLILAPNLTENSEDSPGVSGEAPNELPLFDLGGEFEVQHV
ncbi:hypothetical protein [Trichlorobacter lovleyi]|uniref:hypothetical protein n=1 Tax=Trichlorobacter lovleyi TaxID=313985 RepID=UPI002480D178|nr:hypothetical protein [Trichlorobacter lovleyi]